MTLSNIAQELTAAVDAASATLKQMDDAAASASPGAGRWSHKQVIGHLIDSAANNHQRFVRAQQQQSGEFVSPGYEQNFWVEAQAYESRPWAELVELWRLYNLHLAHVIRHMPEGKLGVACRVGESKPVSLGYLVEDYVRHLRHHLAQIGVS